MPKPMLIEMQVPSGSRPSALMAWLNKLLEPHKMSVTMVSDVNALDKVTPQNEHTPLFIFEVAFRDEELGKWDARDVFAENKEDAVQRFRSVYSGKSMGSMKLPAFVPVAVNYKNEFQRFQDGRLKPFIEPHQYDELRDDDKFLYNRKELS